MTNQPKHTETPYKENCLGSEGYDIRPVLTKTLTELKQEFGSIHSTGFRDKVGAIARLDGDFERQKANARFISTACNNHEKLVEMLKVARAILLVGTPKTRGEVAQEIKRLLSQIEKEGE